MKRYRVLQVDFDSRAAVLTMVIHDGWGEIEKQLWAENKRRVVAGLLYEYGAADIDAKIQNLIDLGPKAVSIIAYHNKFYAQVRAAFIAGAYYPALTGACALGERILNHLMLKLRDHFKTSKEYNRVYRKQSFADWEEAINILEAWAILVADVPSHYRALKRLRNAAIHYRHDVDTDERNHALEAIRHLSEIIQKQFGAISQPWFIENTRGAFFIKKECEKLSFIEEFYLPNCVLLSPFHCIEVKESTFIPLDDYRGEDHEISDEEYVRLFEEHEKKLIEEQRG